MQRKPEPIESPDLLSVPIISVKDPVNQFAKLGYRGSVEVDDPKKKPEVKGLYNDAVAAGESAKATQHEKNKNADEDFRPSRHLAASFIHADAAQGTNVLGSGIPQTTSKGWPIVPEPGDNPAPTVIALDVIHSCTSPFFTRH